jgi:hypothetical protein
MSNETKTTISDAELKATAPPERMLKFFRYEHLPPALQAASQPFCDLARKLCETTPPSPERTKALNALCEAKDWAVRCLVPD